MANIFLHYAFDRWMAENFPTVKFERYADDAVVHCVSAEQARMARAAIAERFDQVGLELHPDKTHIVYCKDSNRKRLFEHERFDFLGFTFAPRAATSKLGDTFVSFSPAASNVALKAFRQKVRRHRHQPPRRRRQQTTTLTAIRTELTTRTGAPRPRQPASSSPHHPRPSARPHAAPQAAAQEQVAPSAQPTQDTPKA